MNFEKKAWSRLSSIVLAITLSFWVPNVVKAEENAQTPKTENSNTASDTQDKQKEKQTITQTTEDVPITEVDVNTNRVHKDQPINEQKSAQLPEGSAESGYRITTADVGPLGERKLTETPYTINVIPGELIKNREAHNSVDALKTNPTVTVDQMPNGYIGHTSIQIRGISLGNQSYFRDGLQNYPIMIPATETVERIEVINGPSGFLYGFAPGGIINYVSKQPTATPLSTLTTGVYDGGIYYTHFDFGGPADKDGRLTYRINALAEEGDTYVDGGEQKRKLFSAAFDYKASSKTTLKFDFLHQDLMQRGLQPSFTLADGVDVPSAANFDATKMYGQPWTSSYNRTNQVGVGLETKLSDDSKLRVAYRHSDLERRFSTINANLTDNLGNYKETYQLWTPQEDVFNSAYIMLDKNFTTGTVQHALNFGFTHSDYLMENNGNKTKLLGIFNINSPYTVDRTYVSVLGTGRIKQMYDNILLADTLTFNPKWSALVGVTHSQFSARSENVVTKTVSYDYQQSKFSPGVALMYKPTPNVSTYVSYMDGLVAGGIAPNTAANAKEMLQPSISKQYEAGIKTAIGKVDVSAALFKINEVNEFVDPSDNVYKQDGREVHKGFEFTAAGKLNNQLKLVGGFTILNAKVTNAVGDSNGKIPVNVPKYKTSLYLEYDFPHIENLTFTTGVNFIGKRPVDSGNDSFISAATTWDAGLRYKTKIGKQDVTYNLNVTNLFNKKYWESAGNSQLWLGAPRITTFSVQYAL